MFETRLFTVVISERKGRTDLHKMKQFCFFCVLRRTLGVIAHQWLHSLLVALVSRTSRAHLLSQNCRDIRDVNHPKKIKSFLKSSSQYDILLANSVIFLICMKSTLVIDSNLES